MNTNITTASMTLTSSEQKLVDEKTRYLNSINSMIDEMDIKQSDAAELMGITQPRVSNIAKSRLDKFTLDFLFVSEDKLRLAYDVFVAESKIAA